MVLYVIVVTFSMTLLMNKLTSIVIPTYYNIRQVLEFGQLPNRVGPINSSR